MSKLDDYAVAFMRAFTKLKDALNDIDDLEIEWQLLALADADWTTLTIADKPTEEELTGGLVTYDTIKLALAGGHDVNLYRLYRRNL